MVFNSEWSEYISRCAVEAMLYEVSATPKPGLVDRSNSGAHKDMNFFSFLSSSAALQQFFYQCAQKGTEFDSLDTIELLRQIRGVGIEAEKKMYQATGGANTHKGLIFSLGIISAAAGKYFFNKTEYQVSIEKICRIVSDMTKGIVEQELAGAGKKDNLTHGESLYLQYGFEGIRGEVEKGFITVRRTAFPLFLKLIEEKRGGINDVLVQVLLHLMMVTEDSNVLARHDLNTLEYVRQKAAYALSLGGIYTAEGKAFIIEMDEDFIEKNISPGGCADLLAVTIMLYSLYKTGCLGKSNFL